MSVEAGANAAVALWLTTIGCTDLAEAFAENHITLALLPTLTEEDLMGLGVADEDRRAKMLSAISALREIPREPHPQKVARSASIPPPPARPAAPKPPPPRKPAPPRPGPRPAQSASPAPVAIPLHAAPVAIPAPAAPTPTWAYAAITALTLVIIALLGGGYIFWSKTQPQKSVGASAKPKAVAAAPAKPAPSPTKGAPPAPVAKQAAKPPPKPGKNILVRWDFEGGKPIHSVAVEGEPPQIVPDPLNPKNKVMLSILKPGQARAERSELRTQHTVAVGDERWVGMRMLRPEAVQNGFTCFFQLGPISGAKGLGGGGLYQLAAYGKEGSYQWRIRGFLERLGAKPVAIDLGPVTYGRWEDWVFHLKLRADNSGLLEAWRDGKLVATHSGQNAQPGDHIPIKWGVYVGSGNVVPNEIHALFDDITIAGAGASYAEVAPPHAAGKP